VQSVHVGLNSTLLQWGTEAQRQRYLRFLHSSHTSGVGTDARALQTTARPRATATLLNGRWIRHFASDHFLAPATVDKAKKHKGGRSSSSGFKDRAGTLHGAGDPGRNTGPVNLDDCEVPVENRLGEEGEASSSR
jgi:alkylation response protein AidB-like acyl-CoA dehydrogenase